MKSMIKGLLLGLGLSSSMANADFLGEADDTYIGFRVTRSFDANTSGNYSHRNEYGYLLLAQRDGIKNGVSFMQNGRGERILGYLGPYTSLDIGVGRISDYALPIVRLDAQANSDAGGSTSYAGVGLVVLLAITLKLKHDLESDWQPAN